MAFIRALVAASMFSVGAYATTPVILLPAKTAGLMHKVSTASITNVVRGALDLSSFSQAKVQVISGADHKVDHLLVHLQSKTHHRVEFASIHVTDNLEVLNVDRDYKLGIIDRFQQPAANTAAVCPDKSVQFIAFAPNSIALELQVTKDVAAAAVAKGLKTVTLLESAATTQAYLNYMSCPNLVGNFYDGDANPSEFVTFDGLISADQMKTVPFRFKVTNIWLACEAYNDPMLSSVTVDAKAQKYAAGINDLLIGPSDNTGKCAMIAAINGKPMTSAFNDCYSQFDTQEDQWGFGGQGSDNFGQ